jgi:FkbM family methyltransferase
MAALDLDTESVAVVAGAYEGVTMRFIAELYGCHVLGFEPQEWAVERANKRLHEDAHFTKATVFRHGIGAEDGVLPMGEVGTDAASFVNDPAARTHGVGKIREWGDVMSTLAIDFVDLLLLNVEGYEYILLPHLKKIDWMKRIKHIIIQFHDMDRSPYHDAVVQLAETHVIKWEHANWYLWTWQMWERVA